MGCGGSVAKSNDQANDTSTATSDESKHKAEASTATTKTEPPADAKSTQLDMPFPNPETLEIAKKVGEIALIRAQDSVTAAVRSWPPDNQTGKILVKSSPSPDAKPGMLQDLIEVGFDECYCCYFNKYCVSLKSVGLWEVKLLEHGTEHGDKSVLTQAEGFTEYVWGKDNSIRVLDFPAEAPPTEGQGIEAAMKFPNPETLEIAKKVGEIALIRAQDSATAAVRSWPPDNQTGKIMVKSSPSPDAEPGMLQDLIEVGFDECYCCYFNKYCVSLKSVGLWEVKLLEHGTEHGDKSVLTQAEGFTEYVWEKDNSIRVLDFPAEAPPTEGQGTEAAMKFPNPETLEIAKKVGEIALIRAQDSATAAVRSWPPDNQTGKIMVKSSPSPDAEPGMFQDLIEVGFEECYCCYFNKYCVSLKSVGLWEVKLLEHGTEHGDKSVLTQAEGFTEYVWGKDNSIHVLDFPAEAPPTEGQGIEAAMKFPNPETLEIAKKVGEIALIRAQDSATAAVRSWPPDNQTGKIMVKSSPSLDAEPGMLQDLIEVGFDECYCCYFNKYCVSLKSVGLWEVKLLEHGTEHGDKSVLTQAEGFTEYVWEKDNSIRVLDFPAEAPPTEVGGQDA